MAKTAMITTRVEPVVKKNAEKVFKKSGISTTEAISIFFIAGEITQGIAF